MAPSTDEQERLIRRVLSEAKIDPSDVGFVEAHGTGTKVGDPIEATAIFEALGGGRKSDCPLFIGSAKSNIGHLENASGLISVIKAALILEKGFVVPNADFRKANPAIPLAEWNLQVKGSLRLCVKAILNLTIPAGSKSATAMATTEEICGCEQLWILRLERPRYIASCSG